MTWSEVESRRRGSPGPTLRDALLRRKGLIGAAILLGLLLGGLYRQRQPIEYQSTAQILLVRNRSATPSGGGTPALELPVAGMAAGLIRQIGQPQWIGRVVAKNRLAELPSLAAAADPAQTLLERLAIVPLEDAAGASLIELRCRGPAADDCRRILEALIEACLELLRGRQQAVAGELQRLLEQCQGTLTEQIRREEKAYEEFCATAPDLGRTQDAIRLHEQRIGDCEQSRTAVLKVVAELTPRIESIEAALKQGGNREALSMLAKNLAAADAGPAGPRAVFDQQLFVAQLEERQLLAELGGDHPRVKEARRKAQLLREKLGIAPLLEGAQSPDFVDVYLNWLRQERRLAETKLKEIESRMADERAHIVRLDAARRKSESLQTSLARSRSLFDAVVKRLLELTLADEEGRLSVRLVSPPNRGEALSPGWPLVLGLGGGLGLVIGMLCSGLVELAARRWRFAAHLQQEWATPVLGQLPVENRSSSAAASPCTLSDPQGAAAAGYRRLQIAVERQIAVGGRKVIVVSSPGPGQGKSLWAANLAVLAAQAGRRVLLVEADFRRSRLHECFALDNSRGLSTLLSAGADLSAVLRETKVPNLWALAAGPAPDEPADLLVSPRFRALLDTLRPQFELLVLSAAPVLDAADAALVAARADGVLLAVSTVARERHKVLRSLEIIRDLGTPILGVALGE